MYNPFISKEQAVKAFIQRSSFGRHTNERQSLAIFNQDYTKEVIDFPYELFVEDDQYSIDDMEKELFLSLGPNNGECIIERMEKICPIKYKHLIKKARTSNFYEKKRIYESTYYDVEHFHDGDWKSLWITKTGYDYGINAFAFKYEHDRDCAKSIILLGLESPVL